MRPEASLFCEEECVIAEAEAELDAAGDSIASSSFACLLKNYKKLYKQSKRLVKMGDRMQGQLNRLNDELVRSEAKYRSIFESSIQGIYRSTPDGRILDLNPAMAGLFGFDGVDEMLACVGNIAEDLFWDSDGHDAYVRELRRSEYLKDHPLKLRRSDGAVIWVEVSARGIFREGGELVELEGLLADVTEKRRMLSELETMARCDGLTGVWNRRYFMELGHREMMRADREDLPLSLVFFDVDHFKSVNDTYGHDVGDAVLVRIAKLTRKHLREMDIFGRVGGEEFAALLPGAGENGAVKAAEKLRAAVEAHVISTEEAEIRCTASFGVASRRSGEC